MATDAWERLGGPVCGRCGHSMRVHVGGGSCLRDICTAAHVFRCPCAAFVTIAEALHG